MYGEEKAELVNPGVEEQEEPDFPRGQVSGETSRLAEEADQLHRVVDVLEQRLRMGGVLRSVPERDETTEKGADLREIKVPLAERIETQNGEVARATSRIRKVIELIEL